MPAGFFLPRSSAGPAVVSVSQRRSNRPRAFEESETKHLIVRMAMAGADGLCSAFTFYQGLFDGHPSADCLRQVQHRLSFQAAQEIREDETKVKVPMCYDRTRISMDMEIVTGLQRV